MKSTQCESMKVRREKTPPAHFRTFTRPTFHKRQSGKPVHRQTDRAASLGFWENYAPWYEQWLCHNKYHEGILRDITSFAKPGWKVLDIGAGSGVLSAPLSEKGCEVTALEPSFAMRHLLRQKAFGRRVEMLDIEKRPWEEVPPDRYYGYDLMIACNSLHLSCLGFYPALEKVFLHQPERIFLATEFLISDIKNLDGAETFHGIKSPQGVKVPLLRNGYALQYARIEKITSSFVYHNTQEAISHWTVIKGRPLYRQERIGIALRLRRKGTHLCLADEAFVGIYYWTRRERGPRTVFKLSGRRRHTLEQ